MPSPRTCLKPDELPTHNELQEAVSRYCAKINPLNPDLASNCMDVWRSILRESNDACPREPGICHPARELPPACPAPAKKAAGGHRR